VLTSAARMFRAAARRLTALPAVLVVALAAPAAAHAASYPPEFHFRTITTDRVSVHFHQGFEGMARSAAVIASEILARYEARYGSKLGRVQLVIVDSDDLPNGFATPLPYPLVTIRAVAPDGSDGFGNHEGWLRLVLSHELAHTVHLEEARGIWRAGRTLLGRAPFLFPNSFAMSWMIEGLATYEETEGTAYGRGRGTEVSLLREIRFPHSVGLLYSAFTAFLGFEVNEGEYKVIAKNDDKVYQQDLKVITGVDGEIEVLAR